MFDKTLVSKVNYCQLANSLRWSKMDFESSVVYSSTSTEPTLRASSVTVINALTLPSFRDEVLGELIVSPTNFPFLTTKARPDLVHIFPNDIQMAEIKTAAEHHQIRAKRQESGKNDTDMQTGFAWFDTLKQLMSKFLKFEFGHYLVNRTTSHDDKIKFDTFSESIHFSAMRIPQENYMPYLEKLFNSQMRNISAGKRWFPAEKLIQQMEACWYFDYGSAGDQDFQFDKNIGGTMVYYKVTCMRKDDKFFVGLSIYDSIFTLKDIMHEDIYQDTLTILFFSHSETRIDRWFEKRYLTLDEVKTLHGFIMERFAEQIGQEYSSYLEKND